MLFTVGLDKLLLNPDGPCHLCAPSGEKLVDNCKLPPEHATLLAKAVNGYVMLTLTLPDMVAVQPPMVLVASTVYVPTAVCRPKLMLEPVPDTGLPTVLAPFLSWYVTPTCESDKLMVTPVPP